MIDGTDEVIERVAAELRAPVHLDATFDDRVMRAIRAEGAGARRAGAFGWLTRPRSFQVSPLAGLAYAAALVLMVGTVATRVLRPTAPQAAGVAVENAPPAGMAAVSGAAVRDSITVTFVLRAPTASRVMLVGDFNDWNTNATPLRREDGEVWTVTVPLVRGLYNYNFVLDGREWVTDPSAPSAAGDDSGRPSSVVMVAGT